MHACAYPRKLQDSCISSQIGHVAQWPVVPPTSVLGFALMQVLIIVHACTWMQHLLLLHISAGSCQLYFNPTAFYLIYIRVHAPRVGTVLSEEVPTCRQTLRGVPSCLWSLSGPLGLVAVAVMRIRAAMVRSKHHTLIGVCIDCSDANTGSNGQIQASHFDRGVHWLQWCKYGQQRLDQSIILPLLVFTLKSKAITQAEVFACMSRSWSI